MPVDIDVRLKEAMRRRDLIADNVKRIEGRLEAARQSLADAEKECRERNIDPNKIDEHLTRLETRYAELVSALERDVETAEQILKPYLKEINP
jgi:predicted nuclease with TOPRIM domain